MFGERLKELRIKFGLKQHELAEILNVSQSTIGMYENDQRTPPIESIVKLAEYFNVTTDYLLGHTKTDYSVNANIPEMPSIVYEDNSNYDIIDKTKHNESEFIDNLDTFLDSLDINDELKYMTKLYAKLDEEDRKAIKRMMRNALK
ncbi:helix-turn-helix domain-containing protein [Clostridioides difficile]|uniref:helix-turn-helix domain-containing protein n=1 Tax=Clostridioides difficile TaxID=1496 RepID=UPI001C1877CA|nr:helix-turn-helix transcriptional regulator [Clostridioides difficile]MDY6690580.1 helix-turn-helix transcriptional regulator [Clostridioides difficile]HBF5857509.1 helix-turn-helix transcriptional regulator [Clostridioides difficile]HBG3789742.1 helix-turn-helix transcriptional regulator [Clostridioides difficile]HBG4932918.1 helix-turn-helix transcriptional regulator [Clostridioides difficile]HBG7056001.1 helix-turn-helix transcriptional regulator [Clostridioides difficile]